MLEMIICGRIISQDPRFSPSFVFWKGDRLASSS